MAVHNAVHSNFLLLFFLFISGSGVVEVVGGGGFEVELIHRDSTASPLYNHSVTPGEWAREAYLRSLASSRIHAATTRVTIASITHQGHDGTYLMKLSIGIPPTLSYAIMDTGSDLAWVQCAPCRTCFNQETPLYDSTKSLTYRSLLCNDRHCTALPFPGKQCRIPIEGCKYEYDYADSSSSEGLLATETFKFQTVDEREGVLQNMVFGCGQENKLLFPSGGSGIIGLGGGIFSLISQFGSNLDQKFSYCLTESPEFASNLKIGLNASISGGKLASTPLIMDEAIPTYYFLTLEGVTVGDKTITSKQISPGEGNTVIDSGSMITALEMELYDEVISTLKKIINLETVEDPKNIFGLCYESKAFSEIPEQKLVIHFTGADLELRNINLFSSSDGRTCFAMVRSRHQYAVYGSTAQTNFEVEYDLDNKVVSFVPTNCSQFPWKGHGGKAHT